MELNIVDLHVGQRVVLRNGTITLIISFCPGSAYPVQTLLDAHRTNGIVYMPPGAWSLSGLTAGDIVELLAEDDL